MRVVAEIPHPDCRITIFSMNQKFLIKLEKGAYEQTYKIAEIDIPEGVNGVFQLLDSEFISTATKRFLEMKQDFNAAFKRFDTSELDE